MKLNSIYLADGYKANHHSMYQDGLEVVYSNFTPRSSKYAPKGNNGKVLNFGHQYAIRYIVEHFNENFFSIPKEDVVKDIKTNLSTYLGSEYDTKHIGETLNFPYGIVEANDLKTNDFTKNWNGMGIFAKDLYDDESLWNQLPQKLTIQLITCKKEWIKEEAKAELLDCYYQLGAKNLYE